MMIIDGKKEAALLREEIKKEILLKEEKKNIKNQKNTVIMLSIYILLK